jgi:hypothetical protein
MDCALLVLETTRIPVSGMGHLRHRHEVRSKWEKIIYGLGKSLTFICRQKGHCCRVFSKKVTDRF